jgi:hypothetical protein
MRKLLIALMILMSAGSAAQASEISSTEALLRRAMAPGSEAGTRRVDSGVAIRAYIAKGLVRRKPDQRADYVDYRRVRKPAKLFGHKLIVIEEEYLTVFIGCCVNTGIGIVIEQVGSLDELDAFITANRCSKNGIYDPKESMKLAGVKPTANATYVSISCRENDL